MRRFLQIAAVVLIFLLCVNATAVTVVGSLPDENVYVCQPKPHTCTLTAATMMLRNYSFMNQGDYEEITVERVGGLAWSDHGLAREFPVGEMNVSSDTGISSAADRKAYLVDALNRHPEGVVVYNARQPHAVFLFGYRADTDTFFCADTTGQNSMMMIPMDQTLLTGESQDDMISRLTKIWYLH